MKLHEQLPARRLELPDPSSSSTRAHLHARTHGIHRVRGLMLLVVEMGVERRGGTACSSHGIFVTGRRQIRCL